MASTSFAGYYFLGATGGGSLTFYEWVPDPTTAREIDSDGMFRVNDVVGITTDQWGNFSETIIGFYDGGIVTTASNEYYFYTNNANYELGSAFVVTTAPRPVILDPVCFSKGTLIETAKGPIAIEDLQIGDAVQGSTGLRSIKWIGWRHYKNQAGLDPAYREKIAPVRIKKDAIAEGKPNRDLLVSPWHHIFIDGILIRASDIVNGVSITRESDAKDVSYFHIELDQFDVVMAHGIFSETWADGGNRNFFQNVDVTTLRPEDMKRRNADRPGFVALRNRKKISEIHADLAKRAENAQSAALALSA